MKNVPAARLARAAIAALMLFALPLAAAAQQATASGTVKFQLFEINGLVVGDRLNIDADFAERHSIAVPAPFSVLVPRENGIERLAENAPDGPDGPFLKLSFADQDKNLIENIRLIPMKVDASHTPVQQLEALAELMANQVFDTATKDYPRRSRDIVRATKVGGYDAIEVMGRYEDPDLGIIYLRIVGIPNPKGPDGVFVVANVVADKLEIPTPDDFGRTRGGIMLREFRFLDR